jgi:hypothetical protein
VRLGGGAAGVSALQAAEDDVVFGVLAFRRMSVEAVSSSASSAPVSLS